MRRAAVHRLNEIFAVLARDKTCAATSDADDAFTPDQGQGYASFREKVPMTARSAQSA